MTDITKRQLLAVQYPKILVDALELELSAIRTNTEITEIHKCACAAKLTNTAHPQDKSIQIAYTAQYTDDNRVYVEVANWVHAAVLLHDKTIEE
ncbi:MAG: hypothetical protein OXQ90_08075 [Gammaproteobacteria bacterium]|nr:hypothetical protein [Gammaproteobacteria bacterium]